MAIVIESYYLLFVNFLYRYFMITRKIAETKNAFSRLDMFLIVLVNIIFLSVFLAFVKHFEAKEAIDSETCGDLKKFLHAEIVCYGFYYAEVSKNSLVDSLMWAGHLIALLVLILSMMLVGFKTYKLLNQHVLNLPIQKQIFNAILCQSIAPFFLGFLPSLILFVCLFLDINLGEYITVLFLFLSLQPVFDPLFTLLLIKTYRAKVVDFLTLLCKKEGSAGLNSVGIASAQITPEQIEITSF
ncbi:unnamed protein product [Caenorhabditis auriculariae]|uniref:Seven TM Receptor n=1 Tax=Caenorhabditis auriculariae TaxID=2777116 RepID=A0A8S1H9E7_9PELO|nr:unnamed protein product [Caenorhabditis auriculariae]